MGAERRRLDRIEERIQVRFRLRGGIGPDSGSTHYTTFTRNLTEGGLLLELPPETRDEGKNPVLDNFVLFRSILEIDIFLPPQHTPLHVHGTTVWIEKHPSGPSGERGIGIQFKDLDEESRKKLASFIASRLSASVNKAGSGQE